MSDHTVTLHGIAQRLGYSYAHVQRHWQDWDLPAWRIGRRILIDHDDLEQWITQRKDDWFQAGRDQGLTEAVMIATNRLADQIADIAETVEQASSCTRGGPAVSGGGDQA